MKAVEERSGPGGRELYIGAGASLEARLGAPWCSACRR